MRYWWVNQNQTYRHEVPNGYMWSPKLNTAGNHIRAYDLMRAVQIGDVVFSFAETKIKAVGVVNSPCYEFPKPTEFGQTGEYWSDIGWRVDVGFKEITKPIKPKEHLVALRPFLPDKYSPIQPASGRGNQHSYLFDIPESLALALAQLMDRSVLDLVRGNLVMDDLLDHSAENITKWEDGLVEQIRNSKDVLETEKSALIKSRLGQGKFREELYKVESACRITGVNEFKHLVASHTKPWRVSSNEERLDPENGFMLTPTVDHLFDRGYISFKDNGDLLVSASASEESLVKMGVDFRSRINVGSFSGGQKYYLEWHRDQWFGGN